MFRSDLFLLGIVYASSTATAEQPLWGCGLLGALPGIHSDGTADAPVQRLIDGLKTTGNFGKVTYWNWNLAPMRNDDGSMQYLTSEFIFMPEQWGIEAVNPQYVRTAGQANFLDSEGQVCPATMSTLFLGSNEPDIIGSCMGNMMGTCTGSCTDAEVRSGCPVADLHSPIPADPLPNGHCDCWSKSHATGMGFWPVAGCSAPQPLPGLWNDPTCVSVVMSELKKTAKTIASQGYQYLVAPLMAVDMEWMGNFIAEACTGCTDISCGCPSHVGWHFYASDCRPIELGGYDSFQAKLDATKDLMEKFPHLQGAIVNEVGMLNCYQTDTEPICIPNGPDQKYPAVDQPNHACPQTDELPNGFATFVTHLVDQIIDVGTTTDGRAVVAGFSWFNENMDGGTYNLRLFDDDGTINSVGGAYIDACQKWASSIAIIQNRTL
jgi:hypothetical protein